ncbi:hypothetical protein [Kibdelosporangium aridum]|uniref:Uncharacterized protein n=1 Tax=Kibdelosporangium aridum TaxID=2030 RepID=A0A1Y5Y559_KIBAR|nr:hypothetical protein [Kibdelosporangium aridum]SMD25691.1 hypothetical protein SAMN05661093_09274 [Kibdelosporangium aridum]
MSRFKSALRFVLGCVRDGLICLGQTLGPDFDIGATTPAEKHSADHHGEPLSEAEHAEWTDLLKRLH